MAEQYHGRRGKAAIEKKYLANRNINSVSESGGMTISRFWQIVKA